MQTSTDLSLLLLLIFSLGFNLGIQFLREKKEENKDKILWTYTAWDFVIFLCTLSVFVFSTKLTPVWKYVALFVLLIIVTLKIYYALEDWRASDKPKIFKRLEWRFLGYISLSGVLYLGSIYITYIPK